jgi:hypothetical protein
MTSTCTAYQFNGGFALDQSNRYRVEFSSTGETASGRATAINGSTMVGNVSGSVTGRRIDFTIQWDSGPRGRYTGDIDQFGYARGIAVDEANTGPSTTWTSTTPLRCSTSR